MPERLCQEFKRSERHPLRRWEGRVVSRNEHGGFDVE
jgi:hypothetical protein